LDLNGRNVRYKIELEDRSIGGGKAGERCQIRIARKAKIGAVVGSVRSTKLVAVVWPLDTTATRRVVDGLDLARAEDNPGLETEDCRPASKCSSRPRAASIGNVRDRNTGSNERVYKIGRRHTMVQISDH
jgi:hypothetical protein